MTTDGEYDAIFLTSYSRHWEMGAMYNALPEYDFILRSAPLASYWSVHNPHYRATPEEEVDEVYPENPFTLR
jgi:hypothetical protein